MSFRTKWRIYEYIRNSIWIVPALFAVAAIVAGSVFPDIDESAASGADDVVELTPETARGVLGALAGGMITFTGFVFSILLLAVQFGSSQFSPRMLRRFLRDRTTKYALGMFIATFIYSLLVLGSIGTSSNRDFVPVESVTIAVILLLLSMFMFLRLISRTTSGLRVANVLKEISEDASKVISNVYPDRVIDSGDESAEHRRPRGDATKTLTYEGKPMVIQSIDSKGLKKIAVAHDVEIELVPAIGDFLVTGDPLFRIHGGEVADDLHGSIATGDERSMRQDPAFAFRLLADISSKALSPGVNDPGTATQALDQIEYLLRQLSHRRLTPGVVTGPDGEVRVSYPAPSWEDFVRLAIDETRQYGEGSIQVSRRLYALLSTLRDVVPPYRRPIIEAELALMGTSVQRGFSDDDDRHSAATEDRQGIGSPLIGRQAATSE